MTSIRSESSGVTKPGLAGARGWLDDCSLMTTPTGFDGCHCAITVLTRHNLGETLQSLGQERECVVGVSWI